MRIKFIFSWLLLLIGLLFSAQSYASGQPGTPKFVEQERLVEALINMDVYVDEQFAEEPVQVADRPLQVTVDGDLLVMNPHGHIHWYKPYFNHTHSDKPSPDHTHWYIDDYVAVDTMQPVKPIIVAASISPDFI